MNNLSSVHAILIGTIYVAHLTRSELCKYADLRIL